jgi:uncharacterized protein (TIGR02118 family)
MVVKLLVKVYTKEGMSREEAVKYQLTKHVPLVKKLFSHLIKKYVINVVVTTQGEDPEYQSTVEMWFDNVNDVQAMLSSPEFKQQVQPDHANFARKVTWVGLEDHIVI